MEHKGPKGSNKRRKFFPSMSWARTGMLFKGFFAGIVPEIPKQEIEKALQKLRKLKAKQTFLDKIKAKSAKRNESLFKTATRSNSLLVVVAFVIPGNIALLIAPGASSTSQILFKISTTLMGVAGAILTIAIASKYKVMLPPREGCEIEPLEMLDWAVADEAATASNPNAIQEAELMRESNKHHKRKIVLVVERRAQWISATFIATSLLVMVVGVCLR